VERGADPVERSAGQAVPGQPVDRELHGTSGLLALVARPWRRAGLPVDDVDDAAWVVGEDRVDPAAQHEAAEAQVERHLELQRDPVPERAGAERLLQHEQVRIWHSGLVRRAG
jgi:hypothetical protein